MEIKIDILANEVIKSSSTTPHLLKSFKFSLLDQFAPSMYVPLVFFYSAEPGGDVGQANAAITSQRFMKALSEILVHLYPFLGRIDGNIFVDCNDEGVPYTEAHVHCPLSDILKNPDANLMRICSFRFMLSPRIQEKIHNMFKQVSLNVVEWLLAFAFRIN